LLQGQIHWVEVDRSIFLYDINVSRAGENIYGVAVRHVGSESGPIHWATCLYDSSRRLYSLTRIIFVAVYLLLHSLTVFNLTLL